jgi:hypothetical protein
MPAVIHFTSPSLMSPAAKSENGIAEPVLLHLYAMGICAVAQGHDDARAASPCICMQKLLTWRSLLLHMQAVRRASDEPSIVHKCNDWLKPRLGRLGAWGGALQLSFATHGTAGGCNLHL